MSLSGANLEHARVHNRKVVFEAIRLHGPLTRAEVARLTGLSSQTVSNIAQEMQGAGLLRSELRRPNGRGQHVSPLSINPQGAYSIGLQLDHRQLIGVLVDLAGEVHAEVDIPVSDPAPEVGLPAMARGVATLMTKAALGRSRIAGVGVVMPGPFDVVGLTSVGPTTLPGWEAVPVAASLEELVQLPVILDNDATAGAIGERVFGAARRYRNFIYIFVGMGLGGGIFVAGQPYKGANGNAGELGHLVIDPTGRPCPCGNFGCLEQYLSLHAFYRHMRLADEAQSPEELERLFHAGDPTLLGCLNTAVPPLRQAIGMLESMFDPELIILGGFMPAPILSDLIARLEPLPRSIGSRVGRSTPRIILGSTGRSSSSLGAAVLPIFALSTAAFGLLQDDMGVNRTVGT